MARHARPRYDQRRGRWFACIGRFARDGRRREVYAPHSVRGEADAWRWLAAELAARDIDSPHTPRPATAGAVHQTPEGRRP